MKKVTTLLLLANLFVCLLSAQSMLIDVPEGPARFPISLSESQSVIQLCDLEVGKTYQVVLSSRRWDNCDFWLRHEPWMQEYESQAIVFEASRTCQQVLVLHSCEDELDLTVSTGPFGELQTSPLDARMMGIVAVNNNNVFSLIKDVFIGGDCFEVQGVTPIGNGAQTGTFSSGGSSINIEDGVIISTGDVTNTNGANNSSSTTSGFTGPQNEIDLDDLGGGSSLYDVAGIEFDFTPTVEQVSFEYVFASEEYCEFAGSQFNDVFGFFISGPGINGPFSNGAENIAIIPGNGQYVGINTVNHTTNTAFYFNNNPPGQNAGCSPTPPQAPNDIEFDGFTSVFTAIANVIPCETYHIKLVIADRGDSSYDSAVFLKANSFNAGATAAVSVDVDQGPTSITAYEGCSDGYFIFERVGGDLDEPFPVTFNVSFASTAEAGSDYAPFPTTVIIPPGQTTFTLPVDVFADFEFEGTEQIIIELEDACNCTSNVAILEIVEPPLLDVFIPDIFACQGEEITITPDVSGGIPGYTYQWSNGSTSPSITVTPEDPVSGYTLTVFDECNQQMTTFVTIYSNSPSATLSGEDVICQGDFEAYLEVEFEGFGPFNITYEVDGFIETINGVFGSPFQLPASIPGTYTLLSVEAEGCPGDVSGTGEITIAEVLLDADTTDISCFGLNDGAIDLSPTGGTAPYTYDWDQGLGNVEDVDSLAAGTYTVEVADANGCSSTASFEIIDAAPIDLEFDSIQNIDCTNPNDGAVSANLSGGAGGFTYAWSEGSSSETLDNLSGGTYYLTATDASGCEVIDSVTIVDNIAIPTASAIPTDTLDCATSVVEIDASNSATGGMLNYTWDTNDGSIVSGAQGLNPEVNAPGTYTLIVFDPSNNCADTTSVEIIQDIETPIADAGLADTLNCDATSILLNGEASSNGTEFSYSWTSTDGNIVDGASELAPEIDAPGTYQLIVTNTLNSCTDTAQVLIDQDILQPTVNIGTPEIVTCFEPEVSLGATASGSSTNLTYSWTSADGNIVSSNTQDSILVDAGGTYTLEVEDLSNGCTTSTMIVVDENTSIPTANAGVDVELSCLTSTANLLGENSSTGGPYQYIWMTGDGQILADTNTLNSIAGLPGFYTLTVLDTINGCQSSDVVEVLENSNSPLIAAAVDEILTCENTTVLLDGTGSSAGNDFSANWQNVNGNPIDNANTLQASVSEPGVYTLTVTNQVNGCISSINVQVEQDTVYPMAEAGDGFILTCTDDTYTLDGTPSSQGGNFSFSWLSPNGNLAADANTLMPIVDEAGVYYLEITNEQNGCISTDSVLIDANQIAPTVDAGMDLVLNCGTPVQQIEAQGSDSGNNFSINWNTVNGNAVLDQNLNPSIAEAGVFELVITNLTNGCIASDVVAVSEDFVVPVADPGSNYVLNCVDTLLTLDGSGSSQNGNFTYAWSTTNGNIVGQNNSISPNIDAPGTYQLIVQNEDNFCLDTAMVIVDQDITAPLADAGPGIVLTCADPELSLDGGNSSTGSEFSYSWTTPNGQITNGATALNPMVNMPGIYDLLVTDESNGCTAIDQVEVQSDQEYPLVDAGPDLELNCGNPSLDLQTQNTESNANLEYEWNTLSGNLDLPDGQLSQNVDQAGIFELVVENITNGCISIDTVQVTENFVAPLADISGNYILNCVDTTLLIDGSNSSVGNAFSYSWTTTNGNVLAGANTSQATIDQPGAYTLIVENTDNFCTDTAQIAVAQDIEAPLAEAGAGFTLTCTEPDGTLDASLSSQGPNFSYSWTNEAGEELTGAQVQIEEGGLYELMVVNTVNGCVSTDQVNIPVDQDYPFAEAGADDILNCATTSIMLSTGNSDAGAGFSLQWNTLDSGQQIANGQLSPNITQPGIYELVVTNTTNNCVTTDTVQILQDIATPVANIAAADILNCVVLDQTLDGSNSSQNGPYTYSWSTANGNIINGANTLNPEIDAPGQYQLIVSNMQNFCQDTALVSVQQDIEDPIAEAGPELTLTCGAPEQALDASASSVGAAFSYSWTTSNGNLLDGTDGLSPNVNQAGNYVLEVVNTENGCTATDMVDVAVDQELPEVDAGPDQVLNCAVEEVSLGGGNSSSGSAFSYSWTANGTQTIQDADLAQAEVNEPGTYTLTIINLENECEAVDEVMVAIDTIAPIAEAGEAATLTCVINSLALDGNGSSIGTDYTYSWNSNDGHPIDGQAGLQPTIYEPGIYSLQVTDTGNACSSVDVVEIAIDTLTPVLSIAEPDIITCAVTNIELEASANGNHPLEYSWNTDDGVIDAGAESLSPQVSDAGTYTLMVTNTGNGCVSESEVMVPIDTLAPIANAGTDTLLDCDVTSLSLDASQSDQNATSFSWSTTNGNIVNGGNTISPTINMSGLYVVEVLNQINGCISTDEVFVDVDTLAPSIQIGEPDILDCVTNTVTLEGSSDDDTFEFTWRDSQGNVLGLDNPMAVDVSEPGVYYLSVQNQENGCLSESEVTVIQDIEDPIAEAGAPLVLTCVNPEDVLDGSGSSTNGDFSYTWNTNNGQILGGANSLSPLINQPGTYQLIVVNNTNGCSSSDLVNVSENVPQTADIALDVPLCFGNTGEILVESVDGGFGPYSYSIDGGDSYTFDSYFPNLQPGNYEVAVQDANGCIYEEEVVIPAVPELDVQVEAQVGIRLGEEHEIQTYINFAEDQIAQIRWFPSEGLSCDTCLNPIMNPEVTTLYTVVVTSLNGCTDEATVRVVVNRQVDVYIPNAFSPHNNDGSNDKFVIYARNNSIKKINSLMVFSRWGEPVFEAYNFQPNDPNYGWDGTHRGQPLTPAVFVYWTEVELVDGTTVILKGDISLID